MDRPQRSLCVRALPLLHMLCSRRGGVPVIFDGYEVGGELLYPVPVAYAGPTVFPISLGYFDWVYNTTSYTTPPNPAKPPTITYQDVLVADREDVGQANAIDPDVRQFVNGRKGKIIGYFGWTDQYIAPRDNVSSHSLVIWSGGS